MFTAKVRYRCVLPPGQVQWIEEFFKPKTRTISLPKYFRAENSKTIDLFAGDLIRASMSDSLAFNFAVPFASIIGLDKQNFEREIVNIFLPVSLNICFGCLKEPSH